MGSLQIATGFVNFAPIFANTSNALSWMKQARQMWGNIDYSWQRWVINYSSENQAKFLSSLGIHNIKSIIYWLIACIGFITVVLAWIILRNKQPQLSKELKLYQSFCKKMAKAGFNKKPGETVQTFCQRIQKQRPDLAEKINEITVIYTRLRYEKESRDNDIVLLKRALSALRVLNR